MTVAEQSLALPESLDEPFSIPQEQDFGEAEFLEDHALEELGLDLIERHSDLTHLRDLTVRYFWKKEGGSRKGRLKFGECQKPGGLLRDLSGADFVVWLAADHCEGFHKRHVVALTYHELCHTTLSDSGKPALVGHDVEAFHSELEHYGAWRSDLRRFAQTIKQLSLDDAA